MKWLREQHWKEGGLYEAIQPELRLVLELPRGCPGCAQSLLQAPRSCMGAWQLQELPLLSLAESSDVSPGLCRKDGSVLFHLPQECCEAEPVPVCLQLWQELLWQVPGAPFGSHSPSAP